MNMSVSAGVLSSYRMNTSSWGAFYQLSSYVLSPNQAVDVRFRAGNTSASAKSFAVVVNPPNFSGLIVCSYTLPANTPMAQFQILGRTGADWNGSGMTFAVYVTEADNLPTLQFDDFSVRHLAGQSVASTNCTWNGTFDSTSNADAAGLLLGTAVQLPGIPDGFVPLPLPPGVTATLDGSPEPSATLPSEPTASATTEPSATPSPSATASLTPTDTPSPPPPTEQSTEGGG